MPADWQELLAAWGLWTARLLPAALVFPALAGAHLPRPAVLALAAALSGALLPAGAAPWPGWPAYLGGLLAELGVGAVLALVAAALLVALRMGGRLADELRGASQAQVEEAGGERDTPLGRLYGQLACLAFFTLGGPGACLEALQRSLTWLPLGGLPPAEALVAARELSLGMLASAYELAVGVAFPAALAGLAAELALGFVGRGVQGLPVHFLAAPLKALLALAALALSLEPALASWAGWARVWPAGP
jgi:type III secretory pathway component EscT